MDTNLFVSGTIIRRGIPFDLLEAWRVGVYSILLSNEQRNELEDVFARPRIQEKYRISPEQLASVHIRFLSSFRTGALRRCCVLTTDPLSGWRSRRRERGAFAAQP